MRLERFSGAVCALLLFTGEAAGADIHVAGPAALRAALVDAKAGDRLLLAGGSYGALDLAGRRFSPRILIAAANAARPPVFQTIRLRDVSGLLLSDFRVAHGGAAEPQLRYAVSIRNGTDIELSRLDIASAPNGVAGDDAYGVMIRDSRRVAVRDCRIHDVYRAVATLDSDDIEVRHNVIRAAGSDGVVAGGAVRLRIIDNVLADFALISDGDIHPDAIQIWSRHAARPNSDVVIRGNLIRRGTGDPTQGIFVKTLEIESDRIVIEDNVVEQSMGNGLAVQGASNVVIQRNTVIPFDPAVDRPGIDVRAPFAAVVVTDNIMIAARLAPGVQAAGNEIAGIHNNDVAGFVRDRIAKASARVHPSDYLPRTHAGAVNFVRDLE